MAWTAISTRNETLPIVRGGWLDALRFLVAGLIERRGGSTNVDRLAGMENR